MPEGDSIYRAAATLQRALASRLVTRFESVLPALTRVDDDRRLAGRTIERVSSVGKHVLIHFSGDLVLLTHMRMSGSWHIYRTGERWQRPHVDMRIVIATDEYEAVGFQIPVAEFHTAASLDRSRVAALGPDLLGASFDEDGAIARLRALVDRTIAEALLDQRALAGIGNIYKSEVLFMCGVLPTLGVDEVDDERLRAIVRMARRLMAANVQPGTPAAIVTYRGLRTAGPRGLPSERVWVYGRAGRPCRKCGTAIVMRKQGTEARPTFWCPRCQK